MMELNQYIDDVDMLEYILYECAINFLFNIFLWFFNSFMVKLALSTC